MALDLIMGEFHSCSEIDQPWYDITNYTLVSFHYYFSPDAIDSGFLKISPDKWPGLRKWIISDCEGEVFSSRKGNTYRRWIELFFEFESDALAFKLVWT